jgi:hypothetical protein
MDEEKYFLKNVREARLMGYEQVCAYCGLPEVEENEESDDYLEMNHDSWCLIRTPEFQAKREAERAELAARIQRIMEGN